MLWWALKSFRSIFLLLLALSIALKFPLMGALDPNQNSPEAILHLIDRISFGPAPNDIEDVSRIGIKSYIRKQIDADQIQLPASLEDGLNSLPTLGLTCKQLYDHFKPSVRGGRPNFMYMQTALMESSHARLLRAINSPRQLYEVMVDFWFNHFNVSSGKGIDRLWVGAYERDAIRPHAMGKFKDLLLATAQHPAMLFYLDNWQNKVPKASISKGKKGKQQEQGINENYAREVMELHTLGVNGGYTQDDVIALAHILTGWGFNYQDLPGHPAATFYFNPKAHDFTPQRLLGHSFGNEGIVEGEKALAMLAKHPSTAKHISFKLAQYFVQDNPNPMLVDILAKEFTESDGDIRFVLEALFTSPYFWDESVFRQKFKTPYQYVISCLRATGIQPNNYRPLINILRQDGMPLYGCQTPDGYKNTQEAWLSPDAMLNRISFAMGLVNGRFPLNIKLSEGTDRYAKVKTQVDPVKLVQTLGGIFSENTRKVIHEAPPNLRAKLLLGSPEFMRH